MSGRWEYTTNVKAMTARDLPTAIRLARKYAASDGSVTIWNRYMRGTLTVWPDESFELTDHAATTIHAPQWLREATEAGLHERTGA